MIVLITPLVILASALLQSCVGTPPTPRATSAGRLVITLRDDVSRSSFFSKFNKDNIRRVASEWDIINGFSGVFDEATVLALRGSQEVLSIEEDGLYHATAIVTQNNAPWSLSRLSAPEKLKQQTTSWTNYSYTYDNSAGSGVDIYVVDTGIRTTHSQFGGRARWGATFGGSQAADGHGHGTHMA
ncbi:hypothetical protein EST38_g5199 [Candolleomyces aberdarensis]|uniref:Inhibitor I9 domain-containing protein n=1 Tax=Candolleomyces aberdarensis TaxID=2316362 RepID=A0A4V1Q429_9AGAR|nr:hypothetical protein EST38_g5199 [Candolleomyces aberdarensis]